LRALQDQGRLKIISTTRRVFQQEGSPGLPGRRWNTHVTEGDFTFRVTDGP